MSQITISACLPDSKLPNSFSRFIAFAAFMVTAVNASAGVILICVQAILIMMGNHSVNDVPGLKSVAKATGTPVSIIFRAGA